MVGTLIITHGNLGNELIKSAELIKGPLENVQHICIDQAKDVEEAKQEISNAMKKLDKGKGILILTDLFGGTPSNISLSFIRDEKVEVITGVNLPMVLKLSEAKSDMTLREFAAMIKSYGEKNIMLASDLLNKKVNR
jgi:PTS system mannose-specific IIA component